MVSERKHVRFNFVENQPPPKPPRKTFSPPLCKVDKTEEDKEFTNLSENNGINHASTLNNNSSKSIFTKYYSGVIGQLPTSKTFPMGDSDFTDDFVPRTYATAKQVNQLV